MKKTDLAVVLGNAQECMAPDSQLSRATARFVSVLEDSSTASTVSAVADQVRNTAESGSATDSGAAEYGALLPILRVVESLLASCGKKAASDAISKLVSTASDVSSSPITTFSAATTTPKAQKAKAEPPALRSALVEGYLLRLRSAHLGSDSMSAVLLEMNSDKKMRALEMAELASQYAYTTAKNTKRAESARRIGEKHEAFLTSARKSEATSGTSAT